METAKEETIEIMQKTEVEQKLARIYSLLDITPHPMGTRKFIGSPTTISCCWHRKALPLLSFCVKSKILIVIKKKLPDNRKFVWINTLFPKIMCTFALAFTHAVPFVL